VRLHAIQQTYGERVRLHWRTFPLIPDHRPGRRCTPQTQKGRQRVAADEPRALFVPPALESELPASSLPALTATKCAERQGIALFERFHQRLFVAHFHDNLDISQQHMLWRLAHDSGLDMTRFQQDFASGEAYQEVLHDYAEGMAWFGVSALPTVVFNEKVSLVGSVPEERYRSLLDWLLAGEPGGLIALDVGTPSQGAAGQSAVGNRDPAL
jgi:predicted DsbA family dithiol-disulfide isomerase